VLTAGHTLAGIAEPGTADLRFYVPPAVHESVRPDREFTARLVEWRYGVGDPGLMQEWALLEVVSPHDGMPYARTATARSSAMLFCYGFPAQISTTRTGVAVPWQVQRRLEPVLKVVSPLREDPGGAARRCARGIGCRPQVTGHRSLHFHGPLFGTWTMFKPSRRNRRPENPAMSGYIESGAERPSKFNPIASVLRAASTSARRASRSARSSSTSTRRARSFSPAVR